MRDQVLSISRRRLSAAALALCLTAAGCSAAVATHAPSASPRHVSTPTPPIICDDGPSAHTPMPADCVIPGMPSGLNEGPSLILPPLPTDPPAQPSYGLPEGLATLPPAVQWHGRTVYAPAGSGAMLIGIGPDDTLYVLVERALPLPKPTPVFPIPDVAAFVVALKPDGSPRPGWPSGGVPIAGYPLSYKVNSEGTVFVASGRNPFRSSGGATFSPADLSRLTITAIGSTGRVLPGWPYTSPAALQPYDPEVLVLGPHGTVCFRNSKPGVLSLASPSPEVVYCLGADGKLLPGWPFESNSIDLEAVGPDGTVYVSRVTSNKLEPGVYSYPYQLIALGVDGQPKPGWEPWTPSPLVGTTAVLPLADGRVRVLLGGEGGSARLVDLDSNGKVRDDHPELPGMVRSPNYKDYVVTSDGSLFLSIDEQNGDGNFVNAYSSDGSQKPGWPRLIGGWGDVAVGSDGTVAVSWKVYGPEGGADESAVVALFDSRGNLAPGYPVACNRMLTYSTYGLSVTSDGTAFGTMATATGAKIVAFSR